MPVANRPFPARRALARGLAFALAAASITEIATLSATPVFPRGFAPTAPVPAIGILSVTNCNDSGAGSLRQAMLDARNNAQIDFSQLSCSTITLTTGALTDPDTDSLKLIAQPVVVQGRPKPSITINGGANSRIIEHRSGGELALQGLALINGRTNQAKGGCVYANGRVTATAVVISGCIAFANTPTSALGGGIWSDDLVTLVYSTVSGNEAAVTSGGNSYGGGVFSSYGFYAVFSSIDSNEASSIGYGGGIAINGPALLLSSVVHSNTAQYGAGVELFGGNVGAGDLRLLNTTIAQNHARGFAAGIEASGPLEVYNSTIALNYGDHPESASGILMHSGHSLTLFSSIVADNTQAGQQRDIAGSGTAITGSANLVVQSALVLPVGTLSSEPQFSEFGNYGGQTEILGLQAGSPAINAGSNPLGTLCDQRGGTYVPSFGMTGIYERQTGAGVDIGAFERGAGDRLFRNGFEVSESVPFSCYPS